MILPNEHYFITVRPDNCIFIGNETCNEGLISFDSAMTLGSWVEISLTRPITYEGAAVSKKSPQAT